MMNKQWFVFYTKSRHEKKTQRLLSERHFEVFLPTHKVLRQWSDRKKKVDAPLFSSYIFVRIPEHQIGEVASTPGIAWPIKINGKPAILRDSEYQAIKQLLASGYHIESAPIDVNVFIGEKVNVIDGPLKGMSGVVHATDDQQKFLVLVEGINHTIRVQLPVTLLKTVK